MEEEDEKVKEGKDESIKEKDKMVEQEVQKDMKERG